ncbi:MAG: hypothetical protein AVDCRST_MAG41-4104, partial [uncultured Corynebacteriales bacterium]
MTMRTPTATRAWAVLAGLLLALLLVPAGQAAAAPTAATAGTAGPAA